jgi:hypothetical protein
MARNKFWQGVAGAAALLAAAAAVAAVSAFVAQREKFRQEINFKKETKLDASGRYLSVLFDADLNKYHFQVSQADRDRLSAYLGQFFGATDPKLLQRMVDELDTGHILVYKEYLPEGVNLKTLFLSPKVKYWEFLTDLNGIEKMFHTYNFSVGFGPNDPKFTCVLLQTQGTFFGIAEAVTLPECYWQDPAAHRLNFREATQDEITQIVQKAAPLKPERADLDQKFIDYCRAHPMFQEKGASGEPVISDQEIKKMLHDIVLNKNDKCDVKESSGHWGIQEDYPYLVVEFTLMSRVNIEAFIPPAFRFLKSIVAKAAQIISDEVSAKYVTLSMKNFRDLTQEWGKAGK